MSKTIVFIDSRVKDYASIINALEDGTEVIVLDSDRDGLTQISESLAGKSAYDFIQIFSHGSPGTLYLGSSTLNNQNLSSYERELSDIGRALHADGDLLLYGCNVGAGEVGRNFIDMLASTTDADVAASNDLTGGTVVGGDWELEVLNGEVEMGMSFDWSGLSRYSELLEVDDNHEYVEIAIHEYPGDTNSKVIGVAIFDLSLDGRTEANYNNFVALISSYERNDYNFDGESSWAEQFIASKLPENLGKSSFTYIAYKQLAIELADSQFDQKANQSFVSIATDLTAWGFSEAYGIEKSFVLTLANQVKGPIIGSIVDNAADGFIPQFFLKKGLEYLLDELIGSFTPDKTDESYDFFYIENANGTYNDDYDYVYEGSSLYDSINLSTGSGDDILIAGFGDDTLNGGRGNDTIYGGSGNDVVFMSVRSRGDVDLGDGDDMVFYQDVISNSANINGGDGIDGIDVSFMNSDSRLLQWGFDGTWPGYYYYAAFDQIHNSLSEYESFSLVYHTGPYSNTVSIIELTSVERINITGTERNDLLLYMNGERYFGRDGDDTFYADWSGVSEDIVWDNDPDATVIIQGAELSGLERLLVMTGSGDDEIRNTRVTTNDYIDAGDGDDVIDLGRGNDTIYGRSGNDFIVSSYGDRDSIDGGLGDDDIRVYGMSYGNTVVDGGEGSDKIDIDFSGINDDITSYQHYVHWKINSTGNLLSNGSSFSSIHDAVSLGFTELVLQTQSVSYKVTISGVEQYSITGTDLNDLLLFSNGYRYSGGAGTDTFYADWSGASEAIVWDNDPESTVTVQGAELSGIERLLIATGSGYDEIRNMRVDTDDYIDTGDGDDTIEGGEGNDTIIGGEGKDIASYKNAVSGVAVNLVAGAASGGDGNDSLSGIEGVSGSAYGDELVGDGEDNEFTGNDGDDIMTGGAGNDTLDGGEGSDRVIYRGARSEYTVAYDTAADTYTVTDTVVDRDGTDTVIDVEHFEFSDGTVSVPVAVSFKPVNGSNFADVDDPIEITFSEDVVAGNGVIELHEENGLVESYDVISSANLTFDGVILTIDPTDDLEYDMDYSVVFDNGAVLDLEGLAFDGDAEAYAFTTEEEGHMVNGTVTFWNGGELMQGAGMKITSLPDSGESSRIELHTVEVLPDGSRVVEIRVNTDRTDVESLQLEFRLEDGASVTGWEQAEGLDEWTFVENIDNAGEFILGGFSLTAFSAGETTLGTLTVSAATDPDRFVMSLDAVSELGGTALQPFRYHEEMTESGVDGVYSFEKLGESCYGIEASMDADSSLASAVKSTDALDALKIAVGISPNGDGSDPEAWQYLAADVDQDGDVQSKDALDILKMAVRYPGAPEHAWLIVPESAGDEPMSRFDVVWPDNTEMLVNQDMEVDYVGIVRGDVNGSWTLQEPVPV